MKHGMRVGYIKAAEGLGRINLIQHHHQQSDIEITTRLFSTHADRV